MKLDFKQVAAAIANLARDLHARGWVPATSGNFSARLADGNIAITASGRDKSQLSPDDILRVGLDGTRLDSLRPSAETALHLQLYRRDPAIGAVLHTHSVNATLASMQAPERVSFEGLELLKAFAGIDSHESVLDIPVFDNRQDMAALAVEIEDHMVQRGQGHAYLLRGHGVYTWGADLGDCLRHLEALEYLFEYHRHTRPVS